LTYSTGKSCCKELLSGENVALREQISIQHPTDARRL
jgi:hypothetical protein